MRERTPRARGPARGAAPPFGPRQTGRSIVQAAGRKRCGSISGSGNARGKHPLMPASGDDPGPSTAWRRYIGGLGRPATAVAWQTTGTAVPRRPTSLATISRPTCTSGPRLRAKHPDIGGLRSRQKRAGRVVEAPPAHAHSGGGGGTPAPRRAWPQYSSARAPPSSPCPHAPWRFWGVDGTHTTDSLLCSLVMEFICT
jgi:hypothetical protein